MINKSNKDAEHGAAGQARYACVLCRMYELTMCIRWTHKKSVVIYPRDKMELQDKIYRWTITMECQRYIAELSKRKCEYHLRREEIEQSGPGIVNINPLQ